MSEVASGIYPVMITPYDGKGAVDMEAVDRLVEYYVRQGCHGVFAVCLSSEMFALTEDERVALAQRVVDAAAGRISVVASGHVSDRMEDQIRELSRIAATGVDGVVMVSNRLAGPQDDDEVLIANMEKILQAIPDVTFGMYECPTPYKRLLTDRVLEAMAASGRFSFIKDTCCDAELIAHRIQVLNGRVRLFNANAATFLDTLRAGAAGFSGVMANFHPDLYVWLYEHYRQEPQKAAQLSAMLSVLSGEERSYYPVSCKYHMNLQGVPMGIGSRTRDEAGFGALDKREMTDLIQVETILRRWLQA